MSEPLHETLYRAEELRPVSFPELYFELSEIQDAVSGLQLLLDELAEDLTGDGYEPARYLLARLALRHALKLIGGLLPQEDRLGRRFYVKLESGRVELVFAAEHGRA